MREKAAGKHGNQLHQLNTAIERAQAQRDTIAAPELIAQAESVFKNLPELIRDAHSLRAPAKKLRPFIYGLQENETFTTRFGFKYTSGELKHSYETARKSISHALRTEKILRQYAQAAIDDQPMALSELDEALTKAKTLRDELSTRPKPISENALALTMDELKGAMRTAQEVEKHATLADIHSNENQKDLDTARIIFRPLKDLQRKAEAKATTKPTMKVNGSAATAPLEVAPAPASNRVL